MKKYGRLVVTFIKACCGEIKSTFRNCGVLFVLRGGTLRITRALNNCYFHLFILIMNVVSVNHINLIRKAKQG